MDDNRLLTGIIEEAEAEAAEILLKAEQTVEEKNKAYENGIISIKKETDDKIAVRLSEIERRKESAIKSEQRRAGLKRREEVNAEVTELFFNKIEKKIGTSAYDDFTAKLIAEGAIAVNDSAVFVSCSFKEKITDSVLSAAREYIRTYNGKDILIKISDGEKLVKQGIIVESSNGRLAYNNQISTRLRRFEEDIKKIIIKGLEKE